jgi:hypothetical protein
MKTKKQVVKYNIVGYAIILIVFMTWYILLEFEITILLILFYIVWMIISMDEHKGIIKESKLQEPIKFSVSDLEIDPYPGMTILESLVKYWALKTLEVRKLNCTLSTCGTYAAERTVKYEDSKGIIVYTCRSDGWCSIRLINDGYVFAVYEYSGKPLDEHVYFVQSNINAIDSMVKFINKYK